MTWSKIDHIRTKIAIEFTSKQNKTIIPWKFIANDKKAMVQGLVKVLTDSSISVALDLHRCALVPFNISVHSPI